MEKLNARQNDLMTAWVELTMGNMVPDCAIISQFAGNMAAVRSENTTAYKLAA